LSQENSFAQLLVLDLGTGAALFRSMINWEYRRPSATTEALIELGPLRLHLRLDDGRFPSVLGDPSSFRLRQRVLGFIQDLILAAFKPYRFILGQSRGFNFEHIDQHPLNYYRRERPPLCRPQQSSNLDLQEQYGFGIRLNRLEFGLTQTQMARLIGIQPTHLCAIEKGYYRPHASTRIKIESVFTRLAFEFDQTPFQGQNLMLNLRPSIPPDIRRATAALIARNQKLGERVGRVPWWEGPNGVEWKIPECDPGSPELIEHYMSPYSNRNSLPERRQRKWWQRKVR